MLVNVVYYTGKGKIRKENEDSLVIGDKTFNSIEMDKIIEEKRKSYGIYAVADGMGGYLGGSIASGIIVKELSYLKKDSKESIEDVLKKIKDKMRERSKKEVLLSHMGSVLTGIKINKDKVVVFNVGDSKTFLFRKKLILLTKDDSMVWNYFKDKKLGPRELHEAVRKHPKKNIVTAAIMLDKGSYKIQEKEINIKNGDKYLICSDGLWEEMTYDYLEECMNLDNKSAAEKLLEKALIEGKDNISFIIVEINDE